MSARPVDDAGRSVGADPRGLVCQVLYSGLGGHGAVAIPLMRHGAGRRRQAMAFIGVEPLREGYARACAAHGAAFAYFPTRPGAPWAGWWSLWRWLRRCRPSVILLHSATALLPCLAYRLASRGSRLVAVEHTAAAHRTRREWLFCALAHRTVDRVVFPTLEARTAVLARIGRWGRPARALVIPNGVDLARFRPGRAGDTRLRLGMAGRFAPPKRHDVLLDMLAALQDARPDLALDLSFAGTGAQLAAVRDAAERGAGRGRVAFTGTLDEEALAAWFNTLDLYVHASDAETHSTAILQAMASGIAVVASNLPSIRAQLDAPAACGLTVGEQTGAAFARTVAVLCDDPARREALGRAGRRNAEALYDIDAMCDAYRRVLGDLPR